MPKPLVRTVGIQHPNLLGLERLQASQPAAHAAQVHNVGPLQWLQTQLCTLDDWHTMLGAQPVQRR